MGNFLNRTPPPHPGTSLLEHPMDEAGGTVEPALPESSSASQALLRQASEFGGRLFRPGSFSSRSVDLLSSMDGNRATEHTVYDNDVSLDNSYRHKILRCWKFSLKPMLFREEYLIWLFLALLGVIVALVAFGIDMAIVGLYDLIKWLASTQFYVLNYASWVLLNTLFCVLAYALTIVISPMSAGSGIPEMKSVLSGMGNEAYLNFRMLLAKVLGLIACIAGGLSVGKEGPYVHMASCIAHLMMKLPCYKTIRRDEILRLQVLASACAAGVAATFGAPMGGVMFSVEVTATFYFVDNLWKGFWTCLCGFVVISIIPKLAGILGLFHDYTAILSYGNLELALFVLIGITFGLLSTLWNYLLMLIIKLRTRITFFLPPPWEGFVKVGLVGLLISFVTFPLEFFRNEAAGTIDYILSDDSISQLQDWWYITGLFVFKYVVTAVCVGFLAIPAGLYTPVFVTGRILGELMNLWFPNLGVHPSSYAIIGAAAMAAGVTQTISSALIVLELTGQISLLLPILIVVLISDAVSKLCGGSAYDVLLAAKGLPFLPTWRPGFHGTSTTAEDIMRKDVDFLPLDGSYLELKLLLRRTNHATYPVVDSKETMLFVGSVERNNLIKVLESVGLSVFHDLPVPDPSTSSSESESDSPPSSPSSPRPPDFLTGDPLGVEDLNEAPLQAESPGEKPASRMPERQKKKGRASRRAEPADDGESLLTSQFPFMFAAGVSHAAAFQAVGDNKQSAHDSVVVVNPCAFSLVSQHSMYKVHYMFSMLGIPFAFIISGGRLVGILTKRDIMRFIS